MQSSVVGGITIATLSDDLKQSWDSYAEAHPQGTFFHLSAWASLISDTFGHALHYLYAKNEQGTIVGLLPLAELKSKLFGHSLVSTPFCVYGGAIADSDEIRIALENEALSIGKKHNVDFVELRYRDEVSNNPNYETFCHHSTFGWQIADDRDAILAGIKKKQRANVRNSLKSQLTFRVDDDVKTAYDIYSESVRNLGTPVFHPRYFPNLKQYFGDKVNVLTVEKDGKAVSSVLNFYWKDEVLPYYGGGIFESRALKSNDLMYYELMCYAKENGYNFFDFGRSKDDSGAFKYKATWGMEPRALHYQRALVNATEHPNLSPNNPKYAMFIKAWQKLPLWLSRAIGPYLSKYLG